jgi:hypothetical protein
MAQDCTAPLPDLMNAASSILEKKVDFPAR